MRIGTEDNFLSIESSLLSGGYMTCEIRAAASAAGRLFTVSHDRVMIEASDQVRKNFIDFESLKASGVEIPLTEGGWLRFERDERGWITVRYRIGGWNAGAAMEGELIVEGEYTNCFCREFWALLETQK